ncbi:MAG: Rab family GTPase [Promethearchaeota archaeon]
MTLFGPPGVGKTSLLIRYIENSFTENLKKTIGTNFLIKDLEIENKKVRLLLWDIGGDERFQVIRTLYFRGSNAALGVYAVDSTQSLLKLPGWIASIKKSVKKQIPIIIIGNKIDLERKIDRSEAEALAKKLNAEYIEASAKSGKNVPEIFEKIAHKCLDVHKIDKL